MKCSHIHSSLWSVEDSHRFTSSLELAFLSTLHGNSILSLFETISNQSVAQSKLVKIIILYTGSYHLLIKIKPLPLDIDFILSITQKKDKTTTDKMTNIFQSPKKRSQIRYKQINLNSTSNPIEQKKNIFY